MGFVKWYKGILEKFKQKLHITDYQIMWIAWLKGLIIGGLIVYFYML
tara:strand:+ start:4848 stop:4988 length:141 start_codon:yes stop_codon:yes gene_type:complete